MTPQPRVAPVDEAVLTELIGQFGDDGGALRADLLDGYLREATGQVAQLVTAAGINDAETFRAVAHSLRSSSALLGATPLARLLAEAEQVAVTPGGDIASLAVPVQDEFDRVVAAFTGLGATGAG